jgi:O-antigen/teichoic acid export membrane protein
MCHRLVARLLQFRENSMSADDRSGRRQVGRNVVTSWASYVVFVIFGFIMPRMIDDSLGQAALGVWDFGWTVVHYLGLAMVGIGSSVNRYVARYVSSGENLKLSRTVSSVIAVQLAIGAAVAIATIVLSNLVPVKMAVKLGDQAEAAGQVILFLGLGLAIQMAFDACRGIVTGCHRWTIHNVINAGSYSVASICMIVVLVNGGGLESLAKVFLTVTLITEIIRAMISRSACPAIEFRVKHVNVADISKVFNFGIKNVLIYLPRLIIQQTVSVMVVSSLGPAMFAVLARPLALVTHVSTLVNKFAHVLTPTAGSLQGSGRHQDLRTFAKQSMRAGWIFAVLPCVYLFVLGDRLVDLWMGGGYANWTVVAILTGGSVLPIATSALLQLMIGMNEHGRIARLSIYLSVVSVVIAIPLVMNFGWSLELAALLIVLPSNIGIGAVGIYVGCSVLHISVREYVRDVLRDPMLVTAVCIVALFAVRIYGPQGNAASLAAGAAVQGVLIVLILKKDLKTAFESLRVGSHKS